MGNRIATVMEHLPVAIVAAIQPNQALQQEGGMVQAKRAMPMKEKLY